MAITAAIVVPLSVTGSNHAPAHARAHAGRAVLVHPVHVLPKLAPGTSVIAESTVPVLPIYSHRGGNRPVLGLKTPNESGSPIALLVKRYASDWLEVYLPVRPNGSTGWIHTVDAQLGADPYRVVVDLTNYEITVTKETRVILRAPVGVGRALTPTPSGLYFITDLLQPTDPTGPYGPYALGLSAHSTVLNEFEGGNGQIGIHGTDDPGGIGSSVSHGCVRVTNDVITFLAHRLPLGTPVLLRRPST
jgi:lipoprotein-anchoring transpeptidase ErfK/SrfK